MEKENPFLTIYKGIEGISSKAVLLNCIKTISKLSEDSIREFPQESKKIFELIRKKFIEFFLESGELPSNEFFELYFLIEKIENIELDLQIQNYSDSLREIFFQHNDFLKKALINNLLFILDIIQGKKDSLFNVFKRFLESKNYVNFSQNRFFAELLEFVKREEVNKSQIFEAIAYFIKKEEISSDFFEFLYPFLFDELYFLETNEKWEEIAKVLLEKSKEYLHKDFDYSYALHRYAYLIYSNIIHTDDELKELFAEIAKKVFETLLFLRKVSKGDKIGIIWKT